MGFEILDGGLFATVQDSGRYGMGDRGITVSGVMDEYAYEWGQRLLGTPSFNTLELMAGLRLRALADTMIAVTGADLGLRINGLPESNWQSRFIREGDILHFAKRVSGQRAYLSVKGGFDTPMYHGSYATTIREGFGKKLQRGDILPFHPSPREHSRRLKEEFIPDYDRPLTIRVMLGYQEEFFDREAKEKFFDTEYEITHQNDRMGYRLSGEPIFPIKGDIISEAIAFGSIQIPAGGQPIILLKERQTIGGYPKIGTVLPMDCFALSQAPIGSKVRFEAVEQEEAFRLAREYYGELPFILA